MKVGLKFLCNSLVEAKSKYDSSFEAVFTSKRVKNQISEENSFSQARTKPVD